MFRLPRFIFQKESCQSVCSILLAAGLIADDIRVRNCDEFVKIRRIFYGYVDNPEKLLYNQNELDTMEFDHCIERKNKMSIYDYTVRAVNGEDISLSDYKGKVIMIVNTATGCGFTPQYAPIEKLYSECHDKGFEVIDIPCNQFGAQAPGTDEEIHDFCVSNFRTTFPQMKKSEVNGENELPLYTYLKSQKGFEGFGEHQYKELLEKMFTAMDPRWRAKPDIKWNFTKFIIDREGNVAARFEPTADMSEVEACVKSLL